MAFAAIIFNFIWRYNAVFNSTAIFLFKLNSSTEKYLFGMGDFINNGELSYTLLQIMDVAI